MLWCGVLLFSAGAGIRKGKAASAEHLECFLEQGGLPLPRGKASFAAALVSHSWRDEFHDRAL